MLKPGGRFYFHHHWIPAEGAPAEAVAEFNRFYEARQFPCSLVRHAPYDCRRRSSWRWMIAALTSARTASVVASDAFTQLPARHQGVGLQADVERGDRVAGGGALARASDEALERP